MIRAQGPIQYYLTTPARNVVSSSTIPAKTLQRICVDCVWRSAATCPCRPGRNSFFPAVLWGQPSGHTGPRSSSLHVAAPPGQWWTCAHHTLALKWKCGKSNGNLATQYLLPWNYATGTFCIWLIVIFFLSGRY